MMRYLKYLSIFLIAGLGYLVYSNTFHSSYHLDDYFFIVDNYAIRDIHNLAAIWSFLPCRFLFYYSLALNYRWGLHEVFGYHVLNLVFHLTAAIFVWWLTLLTLSTPALREDKISQHAQVIALLAGLIFVSHPIQIEAVTYIMQRAASMATMFFVAALCLYVKARILQEGPVTDKKSSNRKSVTSHVVASAAKQSLKKIATSPAAPRNDIAVILCYVCSLILTVLAMFTKEMAITLPLIVMIYEFFFFKGNKNFNWKVVGPFLGTLVVIPVTMVLTKACNAPSNVDMNRALTGTMGISSGQYLLTQFKVIATYIRLLFLPIHQNVDYDYPLSQGLFEWQTLISLFFLGGVLLGAKQLFTKYRLLSFAILWFFVTLLPESSIFPIKDVIFEHRLYLPMVGYCFFLVGALYYLVGQRILPAMIIVVMLIIGANSFLTYEHNKIWEDEFTLWNETLKLSPHKARPHNNRGKAYLDQGNLVLALADFNQAIEEDPNYEEAYNNRGNIYSKQGNFAQAISDYNKAIQLNPGLPTLYYNRGNTYNMQGNLDQALLDFNRAIEISPIYPEAFNNRGTVYFKQGDLTKAEVDFNRALELNPNYVDVYNNLGNLYDQQGNFDQALIEYNKSIEINPNNPAVYSNRGSAYYKHGKVAEAIADFNKAIAIDPQDAEAYNNLSIIYGNQGDWARSVPGYLKAIELNPHNAQAYYNLGLTYVRQGNLSGAIEQYNKAIQINPSYVDAYASRGSIYAQEGKFDLAMPDFDKAIAINPKFFESYINRGYIYAKEGKFDQAVDDFSKAIELNPKNVDAYNNRSNIYSLQGNFTHALYDCMQAIGINPQDTNGYNNCGNIYFQQNNFTQAIAQYSKALSINPRYGLEYTNRAVAYFQLKEYDQAWADVRQAEALGVTVNPQLMNALKQATTTSATATSS